MQKGKHIYNVEHGPSDASIKVEIDFDKKIDGLNSVFDSIKAQVEFWTYWETDLDDAEGDYVKVYLRNLLRVCIGEMANKNHWLESLVECFINKEGWAKIDGTCGIRLLELTDPDFDLMDDYEITNEVVS
jgi:hypothetical protein